MSNEGQDVGDPLAALVGPSEQPVLPADPYGAHGAFGDVVVDLDAAVVDVDPEGLLAG